MEFIINQRDGPARIGKFIFKNQSIIFPNILFINTQRIKAPNFADTLLTNNKVNSDKFSIALGNSAFSSNEDLAQDKFLIKNYLLYPKDIPNKLHLSSLKYNEKNVCCSIIPSKIEIIDDLKKYDDSLIFIVENALQLYNQQSKFVDFIIKLREKIGYDKLIYTPSIGCPSNYGLFTYMGIDLFDSISSIFSARNKIYFYPTGNFNIEDIKEIPCNCPVCDKISQNISKFSFDKILLHNYYSVINEIKNVRNSINRGCLRELIETRVRTDPHLVSILKILDINKFDFFEKRLPIIKKNALLSTSKESLYRPEIKRFQDRLLNRYIKPNCTKILLLLPCSAKKPYSFSKSHKLFKDTILKIENPDVIHEVIITSPIGVVPREIELIYPASNYDIAVTGYWDEDERKLIRVLLRDYLNKNDYEKIILHLPSDITDFIFDLFEKPKCTCRGKPTSKESLENLYETLMEFSKSYDFIKYSDRSFENVKALASFQFGKEIAEELMTNCVIKGKYPYQKIMENNKQLGMITKDRGFISLTLDGAKKISKHRKYWIDTYDDFNLKGSLFAPGIKDTDESIRIGDEVLIIKNKNITAVGVAQMNGEEMKKLNHGEAVKIRHRV
jgi:archaeosine synthase